MNQTSFDDSSKNDDHMCSIEQNELDYELIQECRILDQNIIPKSLNTENEEKLIVFESQRTDKDGNSILSKNQPILIKCETTNPYNQESIVINNIMLNDQLCENYSSQDYNKNNCLDEFEINDDNYFYDENTFDQQITIDDRNADYHPKPHKNDLQTIDSNDQIDCVSSSSIHEPTIHSADSSIDDDLGDSLNMNFWNFNQTSDSNIIYSSNCSSPNNNSNEQQKSHSQTINVVTNINGSNEQSNDRTSENNNLQINETFWNLEFLKNRIISIASLTQQTIDSSNQCNGNGLHNLFYEEINSTNKDLLSNQRPNCILTENTGMNSHLINNQLIVSLNETETTNGLVACTDALEKSRQNNEIYQTNDSLIQSSSDYLSSLYSLANNLNQYSSTGCLINNSSASNQSLIHRQRSHYQDDNHFKQKKISNPFSPECRIPIPGTDHNIYIENKNFIKRRNQRERIRVRSVNDGFENLRKHLPSDYEQYLEISYSNCYLNDFNNNLNISNNSTSSTNELDSKDSLNNCTTETHSNENYFEETTFLDRKLVKNQFNDNSINYSSSSSSSTTSSGSNKEKRLSKVETLRLAINYIKHLENILNTN